MIQDPNSSTWPVQTIKISSPLSRIQVKIVKNLTVLQKHTAIATNKLASSWKMSFLLYRLPLTLRNIQSLLMATWLKILKGQSVQLWLATSASYRINTFLATLSSGTIIRPSIFRNCKSVSLKMQTVQSRTNLSSLGTGF